MREDGRDLLNSTDWYRDSTGSGFSVCYSEPSCLFCLSLYWTDWIRGKGEEVVFPTTINTRVWFLLPEVCVYM